MEQKEIDDHVGRRLFQRRVSLGVTQRRLAKEVRVSIQQLGKYETGINRISASRLYYLSQALDVPIEYFYEGMNESLPVPATMSRLLRFINNFQKLDQQNQNAVAQVVYLLAEVK